MVRVVSIILLFVNLLFSKNILILNSYSPTLKWTQEQSNAIIDNLNDTDIKVFVEYMDTKVFKLNLQREKSLLQYYKSKYKNIVFDIVATTDDNALQFTMKYKNTLFKNSKVFFTGVNNLGLSKTLDKNVYSGVFEEKDPISNLQIAKTINPNLKTIYLIGDDTTTAKKEILHYEQFYKTIKYIDFKYISDKEIDIVVKKLANYEKNSLMMLLVFTGFDQKGKHIDYKKAIEILSKKFNNPMLIHTNIYINENNSNIVAGNCTDGKNAGIIVANNIKRYIDGENLSNIGFSFKDGNKIYINVNNIRKFGIDSSLFNKFNPIKVNQNITFYEKYKLYINILVVISLMIVIFTIILFFKNQDIKRLNNLLKSKVQHALGQLEEQHLKHQEETIKNTKFSTIGQMAAGITHEINTPLTYIKGAVEMSRIDLDSMPNHEYKQRLLDDNQEIMNGINRISIIVESMREMSQATPSTRERANVYDTLITVLRMTYNRSKLISNIKINNENFDIKNSNKDKFHYYSNIHKQRIEQVWTIILNNAFDELVKVDDFEKRELNISIEQSNTDIIVKIYDNAGGIKENILNNIFEPFISTKESSGIGIGLNVAKKILDEHDASIEAVNRDNGACFKVVLKAIE